MAIRYDKELDREINRTIKNYNAKISRLSKLDHELLPSKITKSELKQAENRNELKKKIAELQRFSQRGAEDIITTSEGAKISKYELDNLKRESRTLKAALTKEIHNLEKTNVKVAGVNQGFTFAQMGDDYYTNLVNKRKALEKNLKKLDKQQLKRYQKLLAANKNIKLRNLEWKENYIEILETLGYDYGINPDLITEISDKLRKLTVKDFIKLYNEDKALKGITDYYQQAITILLRPNSKLRPEDLSQGVEENYYALSDNIDEIIAGYKIENKKVKHSIYD